MTLFGEPHSLHHTSVSVSWLFKWRTLARRKPTTLLVLPPLARGRLLVMTPPHSWLVATWRSSPYLESGGAPGGIQLCSALLWSIVPGVTT